MMLGNSTKRRIRNLMRLAKSVLFAWLYLPHVIAFACSKRWGGHIRADLKELEYQIGFKLPLWLQLVYHLHNNRYYRVLFYHRIGPALTSLIGWYRPGDRYFIISATTKIGKGMWIAHPYATVINADRIGDHFKCIHCTTIGKKDDKRPVIGDNVSLGAAVTIIGGVKIGNNVVIGAGSVVVKDLPDNCIAVGNPCKPIKFTHTTQTDRRA